MGSSLWTSQQINERSARCFNAVFVHQHVLAWNLAAGLQYSALGGVRLSGLSRHSANLLCAVAINSMKDVSNSNKETTLH